MSCQTSAEAGTEQSIAQIEREEVLGRQVTDLGIVASLADHDALVVDMM
jgi:hypothetical protein